MTLTAYAAPRSRPAESVIGGTRFAIGLCVLAICTPGCAALRKDADSFNYNTPNGPRSGLKAYGDYEIDLPSLIDPENLGGWRDAANQKLSLSAQINRASYGFYRYSAARSGSPGSADASGRPPAIEPDPASRTNGAWDYDLILRRNAVQDHIIAYADERCRYWKDYFGTLDARVGFGLGSMASVFAVGGAAFKDAATVRALSALAGVATGVRSEFDRAYLHDLSMQVLMQAIDLHRARVRAEIMARRGDATAAPPVIALQAFNAANVSGGAVDAAKVADDAQALQEAQTKVDASSAAADEAQAKADGQKQKVKANPNATPKMKAEAKGAIEEASSAKRDQRRAEAQAAQAKATLIADLPGPAKPGVPAWKSDKLEDIRVYTLERAVADALRYYEACSISGGLEEAAQSVQSARSPDLSSFYAQQLLVLQQQTLLAQEQKKASDIRKAMKAEVVSPPAAAVIAAPDG